MKSDTEACYPDYIDPPDDLDEIRQAKEKSPKMRNPDDIDEMTGLPLWRVQGAYHPEWDIPKLQKIGIPERYLEADLIKDFPKFYKDFVRDDGYFLYGPAGCGKTRLLCGMLKERSLAKFFSKTCIFIPVSSLLRRIKNSFNQPTFQKVYDNYEDYEDDEEEKVDLYAQLSNVDILGLDDLGSERYTSWALDELSTLINDRYNSMKTTYVTSNYDLDTLATNFSGRIARRIEDMSKIILVSGEKYKRN